jgi:hypothetical protein
MSFLEKMKSILQESINMANLFSLVAVSSGKRGQVASLGCFKHSKKLWVAAFLVS